MIWFRIFESDQQNSEYQIQNIICKKSDLEYLIAKFFMKKKSKEGEVNLESNVDR